MLPSPTLPPSPSRPEEGRGRAAGEGLSSAAAGLLLTCLGSCWGVQLGRSSVSSPESPALLVQAA